MIAVSQKLRVVFASEYFWPEIGGLERSTERLGIRLAQLGHSVRMITQLLPGTSPFARHLGIAIHRFPTDKEPFTSHAAINGLFADADVVCLFGVGHDPAACWWLPILDAELPAGGVRLLKVGTDGDIVIRGIPGFLYQRMDGVLCQTGRISEEARAVGVCERACWPIRNGLPIDEWRDGQPTTRHARALLQMETGAFCVIGLGRFTQRKRFGDLIRAFAVFAHSLSGRTSRPVLLLHGSDFGQEDGEELELRSLVDTLASGIDMRFVSPAVDPRLTLAAADVMVTLSEREGAPNVFIEAFASARPVIATDLIGHRVYVCHGREGLLVPVGDGRAVVDALCTMHDHPEGRLVMAAAAHAAAGRFDIAYTAEDYLQAFAAARRRRGAQ